MVVGETLDRSWFARAAPTVAVDLIDKLLVVDRGGVVCSGRIIEVEAYTSDDPASHTYRGRTARNATMFGPPGHLYVYLSYGIHQCANVVTGAEGNGQAVLLRAIEPTDGIDQMRLRRAGRSDRELANGPGKLTQAMDIRLSDDGLDIISGSVSIVDSGVRPATVVAGPRIGITKAIDTPWRFRRSDPAMQV